VEIIFDTEMSKNKKVKTGNVIPRYKGEVPLLTTEQMIEVDRLMIEKYKIELIQMMENAGRDLALVAKSYFFKNRPKGQKVIVLAGTGGNGGGALVCARRLMAWGFQVAVYLTNDQNMTSIPAHQLDILKNMGVSIGSAENLKSVEKEQLIIDGIIGYNLSGAPRGAAKNMIEWANESTAPVLALDTPSGIDLTSGVVYDPAIRAKATLTLALPKKGLYDEKVRLIRGALFLGDISVPPSLYLESSLNIKTKNIFAKNDVIRLDS